MGQIRIERERNLSTLLALHATVFQKEKSAFAKEFKNLIRDERAIVLGARNGSLVGYCAAAPLSAYQHEELVKSYSIVPLDETLYIRFLGCEPSHQGQGIATQLLRACTQEAKAKGYRFGAGHFTEGASYRAAQRIIVPEIEEKLLYGEPRRPFVYLLGSFKL